MRKIFLIIIIIGLGLTGLAYYAETLSLTTLAQVPIDRPGSAPYSPDSQPGFFRDNLERISLLVRIIRYAGIFVLVLAILGFRRSGKSG